MNKSVVIIGTRGYPSFYGGFETLVRRLAPYLVERGWDVTVYGRKDATVDSDPNLNVKVRRIVTPGIESKSLSTLSYGLTASADAIRRKPDVALVMNVANGFFLPLFGCRGIPTVVNVDGIEWERAKWGAKARAVFRQGARFTARYATRLVADSRVISDRWTSDFSRGSDFIPYGGEALRSYNPVEGLKRGGYALVVARFVPENTVEEFFQAAEVISEMFPVVLVGSSGYGGVLDERAESLASSNPNVMWLGHVSDDDKLFSLWNNCGAYFHGHSVGGTNPALVQAMACGAPTVARDTPYNREVLGEHALLVEPAPDAIANAVMSLLQNGSLQDELRASSLRRSAQRYSWKSVLESYEKTLLSAIGGERNGVACENDGCADVAK